MISTTTRPLSQLTEVRCVIPKVVRVVGRRKFEMPKLCPVCRTPVVREEGEVASRCINTNCPARLKESIRHFAARGVMDIDGMGDALVEQLVDKKLVTSVADLYRLTLDQLVGLERMAEKSGQNILPKFFFAGGKDKGAKRPRLAI